jgi:hypothetical protein
MKVVINKCYGGFGLSKEALELYSVYKYGENHVVDQGRYCQYIEINGEIIDDIQRDDPILIRVVEELGYQANGDCAKLEIKEIPDGSRWEIEEYDGYESLREPCNYY